jgi:hypothetical protein
LKNNFRNSTDLIIFEPAYQIREREREKERERLDYGLGDQVSITCREEFFFFDTGFRPVLGPIQLSAREVSKSGN